MDNDQVFIPLANHDFKRSKSPMHENYYLEHMAQNNTLWDMTRVQGHDLCSSTCTASFSKSCNFPSYVLKVLTSKRSKFEQDKWVLIFNLMSTPSSGKLKEFTDDESRSFENSYIPENPRTPKPLTFSKNRLRGAKNRSNISPVAKKKFRKNDFFFSENFAYVQKKNLCICAQSLYNTYLKRFVKKNLKKNAKKKKLHICTKNKKKLHICKRFRSRFFERNNGLGDIGNCGSSRSRSFENSYIPENPRTPKPLTFSKNRLRGAKNRSNISPVAKKFFRKNDFFFPKTLHMCKLFFCAYVHSFLFCFKTAQKHEMSLYNTYLKSCTYAQKIKKSCTYAKVKKKYRFFGNFFQRIVMIKNVLEGSEVGFLKGITCWDLLRTHIFPRTRELPQFPISPKPLFLSKNRLRNPPKPVLKQNKKLCTYAQKKNLHICKSFFRKFFFATGLIFERFLAPRSRFFGKVNGLGVLGIKQPIGARIALNYQIIGIVRHLTFTEKGYSYTYTATRLGLKAPVEELYSKRQK
ncbi:hypothetical protein LXL04_029963 [Taraxacum kok-saghyz]